ncbi:hypothetical protein A3B45_00830 [Candidatus Daviesbacteria bacterium RIFCSPLOWO2_01_FULL_39_12]|uniref:Glycosyl transferase family 1 domain-containing protein n=1 Tax=Candidatus Daviesbacteria bacterium RIFCSPLOWO2_01_FULL_39_12 TaxID=1797785 RepID=A0A1F5KQT0_9BACT|nr:MAG: hypothetical protein A3D79_03750 [Candidatus Daviesbacteria bacterium RIFCSPHIGHO2_02_FULL_39_8]OGE43252.1 MAG: hypothetical protein A3B45_00830 [Candidatus Daviesbacteria bacterium RIFCSPLOWO2_01_FULL_39_12]
MKIGLFFDTYYPQKNGVATSALYLTQALRKIGNQVFVVVPKIKGYITQDKDEFRIPSIKAWPSLPDSVRIPTLMPDKVWLEIFKQNYDIIHSDGNGFFSFIGLLVAKGKKIPYVFTFHTVYSHYTHYIFNGKLIPPKVINWGMKIFGNLCDGIIVPSEKMYDELIAIGIKKPITVIPSFIDLEKFNTKKGGFLHKLCQIAKEDKILLSVGRLEKEKNFEFLIRAFQKVAKGYLNVHLVIVGEGSQRKNLENLIKSIDLEKRVHFTGEIDMELMSLVYKDADIFVFSSVSETQGLCVLEAAASRLPLVLVDDLAYKGVILDNKNGFSLPLDQQLFVDKILLLIKDARLRQTFGEESKQLVESNFSEKPLVDKLVKLYKSYILKNAHKTYATTN